MALVFLTNEGGNVATSTEDVVIAPFISTVLDTEFEREDMLSGARNNHVKSNENTGIGNGFAMVFPTEETTFNRAVVARADLVQLVPLGGGLGITVTIVNRTAGGVYGIQAGTVLGAFQNTTLIGPYQQDFVFQWTPVATLGFGYGFVNFAGTFGVTPQAIRFSKLYVGEEFTFGKDPVTRPPATFERIAFEDRFFTPHESHERYETEMRFTLHWKSISTASVKAFRALPHIFDWPFFLWENDNTNICVFEHELEHVVIEKYIENIRGSNLIDLDITFRRLKHYDVC